MANGRDGNPNHAYLKDLGVDIHRIQAEITLNTKSNKKIFEGNEILKFIDLLTSKENDKIYKMRDFTVL